MSDAQGAERFPIRSFKDTGGIGDLYGVEWCVPGLDRFDANAPNCKMARP